MKFKGQGKKEFIVIRWDDFINAWKAFTVPCTAKQAVWMVNDAPSLNLKALSLTDWKQMQGLTTADVPQVQWKHDAPFNSEFLGAQKARNGEDY